MYLNVFFTPAAIVGEAGRPGDVYIVIDIIRATTTIAVMFDQGARRVLAAPSIEMAQAAAGLVPGCLLCGERNARTIPGFDYGNSPAEFSRLDLRGREMILVTTNGTRALHACPATGVCLAGSLYNARAVTSHALALAREHESNIFLVCAGELAYFALDDAVCAGYLAQELYAQQGTSLQLHESVLAALAIYQAYQSPKVLEYCNSAASVIAAGLQADTDFCMRINGSESVALVTGREPETGLLYLEKAQ